MSKKDSIPHLPDPVNKMYYQETWGNQFTGLALIKERSLKLQSIIEVPWMLKLISPGVDLRIFFFALKENRSEKSRAITL